MRALIPEDLEQWIRRAPGLDQALGIAVTEVSRSRVRCRVSVTAAHLQPGGIVHGGLYCTLVETAASIGAQLYAMERSARAVGIENSTSFLRAVVEGELEAVATPIATGRTTHLWEVLVKDEQGHLAAMGKVRLMILGEA